MSRKHATTIIIYATCTTNKNFNYVWSCIFILLYPFIMCLSLSFMLLLFFRNTSVNHVPRCSQNFFHRTHWHFVYILFLFISRYWCVVNKIVCVVIRSHKCKCRVNRKLVFSGGLVFHSVLNTSLPSDKCLGDQKCMCDTNKVKLLISLNHYVAHHSLIKLHVYSKIPVLSIPKETISNKNCKRVSNGLGFFFPVLKKNYFSPLLSRNIFTVPLLCLKIK